MDTPPPPPQEQPLPPGAPQPSVVVVKEKKRGCMHWLGLGVVGFIGLIVLVGIVAAVASSGGTDDDQEVDAAALVESEVVADEAEGDEPDVEEGPVDTGPNGSREQPFPTDAPVNVTWDVFGDADGSVWTTSVGSVTDFTAEVLAENQFNEEVDGVIYAVAPVSMTLVSADKEPLSAGFNLSFEIHSGPEIYDPNTLDTFGCGVVPGDFDQMTEVFAGGELSGNVCIPIPAEAIADARLVINFGGDRIYFG